MNSRWEIHKIGLVDFWYYDEQEFYFLNGRMLLRGSNGSGKSVTMQSVVPLLLDGNMRPERIDPFGSRDRKMSNYLLEENDAREERTGYLYMELKRKDSETYTSIGIGMRARKGKPLDSWYFYISDGRRIGIDFYLYKETDAKITLSRQELTNRLGEGGKVLTQSEYQEYVNKQIFGFETVEEYKEMIDLLIQLRTPKLSKDFKPSVINEILSNSLQPLSEEDLRPMSEAIENMDSLTINLTNKNISKQAADKIRKNYQKYNEYILYQKGRQFLDNQTDCKKLQAEVENREQAILACNETIRMQEAKVVSLEAEQMTLEKEKESLNASNVVALKKQEEDVKARVKNAADEIAEKEKQLEKKQDRWNDYSMRKKRTEEEKESNRDQLSKILEEMSECADGTGFDEFQFMEAEIRTDPEKEYAYDAHTEMLRKLLERLEIGSAKLREAESEKEKAENSLRQLDAEKKNRDAAERKANEYELLLSQIQNELKEAVYSWNSGNAELKISDKTLKEISHFIDMYEAKSDYHDIRAQVSAEQQKQKEERFAEKNRVVLECRKEEQRLQELESECQGWRDKKEAEPECGKAVLKNRERLTAAGIPYHRFYQVIDFEDRLSEEECNRIEEALLEMGILDALIIDKEYKETVLKADAGLCDKYLFTGNAHARDNILELINISSEANDIFLNQKIMGILGGIGYGDKETTYVNKDGTYGIGILTGTVTGEYRAKYIGEKARVAYRLSKIKELEKEIAEQGEVTARLRNAVKEYDRRIAVMEKEYYALPTDRDLRIAYADFAESQDKIAQIARVIMQLEAQLGEQQEKIKSIMLEAAKIAEMVYLPCRLELFEHVREAMREYQRLLYELRMVHNGYLQQLASIRSIEEDMEECDADMDNIRRDRNVKNRILEKDKMEYASIQEQLGLTNYDEVKERLDRCLDRLQKIPGETKAAIGLSSDAKSNAAVLEKTVEHDKEALKLLEEKVRLLEQILLEEAKLSYVPFAYEIGDKENFIRNIGKVLKTMQPMVQGAGKEELMSKLNASYFENRTYLIEYNLTMDYIFEELGGGIYQDISPRRAELRGKYRGNTVKFQELVTCLEEEIEVLNNLIRSREKELFEDILANIISRKIRSKINGSMAWVEKMNQLMESMNTSSGLRLSLRWRSKTAEAENQLDTKELVELLRKDSKLMTEDEYDKLSVHFRSKVQEARRNSKDSNGIVSFFAVMRDTLDYRKWFEFQLFSQKTGENKKELTNSVFGTFSGGEKAMSMYVPLFSAVVAKYKGARSDAPRIISLDEAFAGVDNKNIRDMFRLMVEFEFNFIINSQILWGDCDTLDSLAIYQLIRPENVKFVTVISYVWNGKVKRLVEGLKEKAQSGEGMGIKMKELSKEAETMRQG